MRYFVFTAFTALVVFFSCSAAYFLYSLKSVAVESDNLPLVKIKIERGDGLREISAVLSQNRLIRSVSVFKTYALISGLAHRLKPGVYELSSSLSTPEIMAEIVAGRATGISLIIPEGATVKEIDRILASAGILKEGELVNFWQPDFLKSYPFQIPEAGQPEAGRPWAGLEGFVFPDTYKFSFGSSPVDVMKKFLDTFETKAWPLLKSDNDWYASLIKASMLEKEIPDFGDRRVVSGIIEKRLKNEVPLQIDATLVYDKCQGDFLSCREVLLAKSDFGESSPYNTYKSLGLPPTPISNPGESAIKAALDPQTSPYWYYLSDRKTKKTYFSKTLDEHNNYRAKYLNL